MKKWLFLIAFCACTYSAQAQSIGGIVYTPYIPTERPTPTPLYLNEPWMPSYNYIPSEPARPTVSKISTEVITTTAVDLQKECVCFVQVRQSIYSNDEITQEIIGIKYSEEWNTIHAQVKYIADLLSSTSDTDAKNALLQCNELATHIAVDKNGNCYLLGLRED